MGAGYVQSLYKEQTTVAAQVWQKVDQREGLMRRLVPVAFVGCLLSGLWFFVDNGCPFHALVIDDVEVGAIVGNGGPGVAAHRADENGVGIL